MHEVGTLPAQGHVSTLQVAGGCPVACGCSLWLTLLKCEEAAVPQLLDVSPVHHEISKIYHSTDNAPGEIKLIPGLLRQKA